jgi:uncharacterized protein YggE
MRNKTTFWIIVSIIAVALLVFSTGAQAQTRPPETPVPQNQEPRTLAVNGNGIITLEPDIAYIRIGVQTEGENAKEAVASNNQQSQQLLNALTRAGVAEKDVETTNFSIHPRQEWDNDGQPTGITYVVDNTVMVTVRDLGQVGALLDAAVQAGANQISGIQFDIEDREAAQQQAMTAAVENARARAEVLAEAAGVTLGEVLSIESYLSGGTPIPYERNVVMADAAMGMEVPVSPGEMQIDTGVSVVYEIE